MHDSTSNDYKLYLVIVDMAVFRNINPHTPDPLPTEGNVQINCDF